MGQRFWQSGCLLLIRVVLLLVSVLAATARSDDPLPAAEGKPLEPATTTAAEQPLPGEVLPKTFWLKDKDGKLKPVPGFPFEEFVELYRVKNDLEQPNLPPRYSIQKLTLTGSVTGDRAELEAKFSIATHSTSWVRVPLRLAGGVLREEAAFDGPGEHDLHFEAEGDGHVVWIRSEPDKAHEIVLKLLAPVVQVGPQWHLRLSVPRTAVSQFRLQVPSERAVAKASEGSTLEAVRPIEGGKSELKVVGLGGEFELSWHAGDSQVASVPTVLEASGAQSIRINGRSITTEAMLTVRSFGGEFDRFQVRLPPRSEYVPQPGVSLVAVDTAGSKGKVYEAKLAKKTTGPVEVRLVAERSHNSAVADELLELAGFDVLGAVRQGGTIAVRVEGNWQVLWGESNQVRQVDDLARAPGDNDPVAAFEYFVQPYSLTARVAPQKTRVHVEPEYVLLIGSDEAQLRGTLKYTIRGAKLRALELELPDWELDLVGPANLVNVDATVTGQASPFTIPLLQATSGELELSFEAHRKIAPQNGDLAFEMPRPRAETIKPANVAVLPADNIELLVHPEQTIALAPQIARPQARLPERQQDPLCFRAEAAAARLVATVKVHEQAISAAVATQLEIGERETRVDERLAFQISYQPCDHLMLSVPRALRPDRLNIVLDGERLLPPPARDRAERETPDAVPLRIALPSARIGRCELQISYSVRHDRLATAEGTALNVPLVVPGEGQLTASELIATPRSGISIIYPPGPWIEEARNRRADQTDPLTLTARRALTEVALNMSFKERPLENTTTIERALVQSRISNTQRQDRVVYRFTTTDSRVKLSLPAGAELSSLKLELDHHRIKPDSDPKRELVIPLAGTARGEHLLEVRYRFAERQPLGPLSLSAPQIQSANWTDQLFWQLILPAHEHMLFAPSHFIEENNWVWSSLFWQRQPTLDDRQLESWIGAVSSEESVPVPGESKEQFETRKRHQANAVNRYLFSMAGTVEPLEIYTLSRARLVFCASLPLLVAGLLLIYFPVVRHPAVLFALAVAVIAATLIDPHVALLVAQASALGLILALGAAVFARVSVRPALPVIPVRGSSKAIQRGLTEMYHRTAGSGSQPSTTTNPLVSTSPPESHA